MLENEARWQKFNIRVDRKSFVDQLKRIRDIRNDIMHFDPDGITEEALEDLRRFSRFVDRLQSLTTSGT